MDGAPHGPWGANNTVLDKMLFRGSALVFPRRPSEPMGPWGPEVAVGLPPSEIDIVFVVLFSFSVTLIQFFVTYLGMSMYSKEKNRKNTLQKLGTKSKKKRLQQEFTKSRK